MQRYLNFKKRNVHGILLLDKPSGCSSSFILYKVKKLFCAHKAGHSGTLDPLATGMLPIFFGKSTKFTKYLLSADKKYRVIAKLGESTNTFDADGIIVQILPIQFNTYQLKKCLDSFKGQSTQIPPMFSSLKYHGLPLYKYARKGINVPRKSRTIDIHDLSLLRIDDNIIELDIKCSKGTYIRSFIHDLGTCLGCGAHVVSLRRLMVGPYQSYSMISMQKLESIVENNNLNDIDVLNVLDTFLISVESLNHLVH